MADLAPVLSALNAESGDLDAMVSGLSHAGWDTATPAAGWTIADQIAHLAWTDDLALLAATDPAGFSAQLRHASTHTNGSAIEGSAIEGSDIEGSDIDGYVDRAARARAAQPRPTLLAGWRSGRGALADALTALPHGAKLPWFGPPMGATSMATARLMETWAHGQDVADALGVERAPTDRLRHVAHLGVRTRDFAHRVNRRTPPSEPVLVELDAPSGEMWTWGPHEATQWVRGPALDFCLLVTQRRHRGDLAVVASGAEADAWLDIAQAFAGPPGTGRSAGQFAGGGTG